MFEGFRVFLTNDFALFVREGGTTGIFTVGKEVTLPEGKGLEGIVITRKCEQK